MIRRKSQLKQNWVHSFILSLLFSFFVFIICVVCVVYVFVHNCDVCRRLTDESCVCVVDFSLNLGQLFTTTQTIDSKSPAAASQESTPGGE